MNNRFIKLLSFTLMLVLLIPNVSFAQSSNGHWVRENFDTYIKVTSYETLTYKNTHGMPGIRFYVSAEPSYRIVRVELLLKEDGFGPFIVKQSKEVVVESNQTKYITMDYMAGLVIGDAKYKISVIQGGPSRLDGSYEFFIKN